MLTYADVCTCSGGYRNSESCYADEDCQARMLTYADVC
jgi:hypothetical protein